MTIDTTDAAPTLTPPARLKAILGGSAGNLVEWYDWFAYSSFTLYFAPSFFPKGDRTAQLLQAAAIFALGFLARPVGAWLMGLYADRMGRRAALTASVALMCVGSLVIAICPGYAVIGAAAPIVLLLARVLQGLSVGGEYGASATYLSEMATRKHRGFWSSFQYVTLIGGQLIALSVLILLQRTLDKTALAEWGWRVPFVIGAILAVVVFWIRTGIEESASYHNADKALRPQLNAQHVAWVVALFAATLVAYVIGVTVPSMAHQANISFVCLLALWFLALILPLLRRHPKEAFIVMGLTAGGSLSFYVYTTYMQKFLVNTSGFSKDQATEITALALLCYMLVQPLSGWISDRIGRKPMLIIAGLMGTLGTYPLMSAIAGTHNALVAFALIMAALLGSACYTAISAVVKAELFPAHVRALGVALPYAVANAAFGGTAEYAALSFKTGGHEAWFYFYASAVMAVFLVTALLMHDTGLKSEILED
ncbi:MAG: ral substrate transporter [Caulobacter sp.]|nr:ral substrate transporter [Caulobacter sp.]